MTIYSMVMPLITGALTGLVGYLAKVIFNKIDSLEKKYSDLAMEVNLRKKEISSIQDLSIAVTRLTVKLEQIEKQIPVNIEKDLGILLQRTEGIEKSLTELTKNQYSIEDKVTLRIARLEDKIM